MSRLLDRAVSHFRPVVRTEDDGVVVTIRGVSFRGSSLSDVRERVRQEVERLREQLREDSTCAAGAMPVANPQGRVNVGAVSVGGTLSRLEAYEAFLNEE